MPAERKIPERERPKLAAATSFIDTILEADRKAPRKQRHTAHRIWTRLRREMPEVAVAESTVRRYVREKKSAMGLLGRETFVPQSYTWGGEAQVDWYEGWAEFDGESRKTYLFCLRSMASGGAFHRAYPHANQQAFLESLDPETVRERLDRFGDLSGKPFVAHMEPAGTRSGHLPWPGTLHNQRHRLQSVFYDRQSRRASLHAAVPSRGRGNTGPLFAWI
jgi:hypothetical protein